MITRMLLASVLAVGASSFAGCGDGAADCPSAVAQGTGCTSAGLTCFAGASQCTCTSGVWQCKPPDMSTAIEHNDFARSTTD